MKNNLSQPNPANQTIGFNEMHLLDVGDFIQATGKVTRTKSGEISVSPTKIKILTKALRPLPDKKTRTEG